MMTKKSDDIDYDELKDFLAYCFDRIDQTLDHMNNCFDRIDQTFDRMNNRFDRIEARILNSSHGVEDCRQSLDDLERGFNQQSHIPRQTVYLEGTPERDNSLWGSRTQQSETQESRRDCIFNGEWEPTMRYDQN